MKYARWILAHALYLAGHVVSKAMWWRGGGWFYGVYNWLMVRSVDVQGPGDFGPWKTVQHSDEELTP